MILIEFVTKRSLILSKNSIEKSWCRKSENPAGKVNRVQKIDRWLMSEISKITTTWLWEKISVLNACFKTSLQDTKI